MAKDLALKTVDELKDNELEDSPSALARANEKRKRTPEGQRSQDPAQNAPGVKEAAERHEPKLKINQLVEKVLVILMKVRSLVIHHIHYHSSIFHHMPLLLLHQFS